MGNMPSVENIFSTACNFKSAVDGTPRIANGREITKIV